MKWPKSQMLSYPDDWSIIFLNIKNLLRPTLPQNNSKYTGFLSLNSYNDNYYEFVLEKDFFVALENSVSALENIYTADIKAYNDSEKSVLDAIHHKIIKLSEEMDL